MKIFAFVWIVLEFIAFFMIAHWIGLLSTTLLLVLSIMFGMNLMRVHGMGALQQAQLKAMMGQPVGQELMDGLAMLMAGIFMVLPGFLSTFLGLLFLMPMSRKRMVGWLLRHGFTRRPPAPRQAADQPDEGRVIEGESWRDR